MKLDKQILRLMKHHFFDIDSTPERSIALHIFGCSTTRILMLCGRTTNTGKKLTHKQRRRLRALIKDWIENIQQDPAYDDLPSHRRLFIKSCLTYAKRELEYAEEVGLS